MTNNRAYEYIWIYMNILYIYYLDIFDTSSNSPPDFIQILDAPQGRHYFAFFWAEVGYEAQLYWLSLAKPRNKSRMRYPWNLIRGCGSPHVTPVFWGKIFGVKWEIFTFRGEKQKKAVESTASSATSGVLEGDVWEVSFPSWGMCYGRSNSSHFTIIGKMFICLLVVVEYSWHSLKMIFMTSQDGSSHFLGHWRTVAHIQPRYKASSSKALMDETSWIRNSLKERSLGITTR